MIRSICAIFIGLIAGFLLILAVQQLGHLVYPLPADADFKNPETLKTLMKTLPVGALLFVLLSYIIGSFGTGVITTLIAKEAPLKLSLIAGTFLLITGASNLMLIPHPVWFIICNILIYLPMAYLGNRSLLLFKSPSL